MHNFLVTVCYNKRLNEFYYMNDFSLNKKCKIVRVAKFLYFLLHEDDN
jgi:hypothetical protein